MYLMLGLQGQVVLSFSTTPLMVAKGAPTVCMQGTKSPSVPSTLNTALPMRVMIFWLTAT